MFGYHPIRRHHRRFSSLHAIDYESHLQQLLLSDAENKALTNIKKDISSQVSYANKLIFSEKHVSKMGPKEIYKFITSCKAFAIFCEHAEYPHTKLWAEALKDKKRLHKDIVALGGAEVSTVFDMYVSSYIEDELRKEKDKPENQQQAEAILYWTKKGCEHKSFYALRARCDYLLNKILRPDDVPAAADAGYVKQLDIDMELICRMFLSIGCLYVARRYYDLAEALMALEEPQQVLAMTYYKKSAAKFLYGKELHDRQLPEDQLYIDKFTQGQGLRLVLGFENFDIAETTLLSKLPTQTPTSHWDVTEGSYRFAVLLGIYRAKSPQEKLFSLLSQSTVQTYKNELINLVSCDLDAKRKKHDLLEAPAIKPKTK